MADIKVGNGSISILSLIACVGALLAFIGLFLAITKWSYTVDYVIGTETIWGKPISGLDFLTNKYDGKTYDDAYTFWKIMPLMTALVGLATIVLGVLPMFGVNAPGVKIAFMVCGIVTFVFALLVFICTAGSAGFDGNTDGYKFHRQVGAYFMLIGGLIAGGCATADKFVKL